MARKTEVRLIDDLDGGEAHETVAFSLDGITYEIDLSDVNAEHLRSSLQPFVEHARKAPRKAIKRGRGDRDPRGAEIRAWAVENGKPVNSRGRIPAHIVTEFEEATGGR